MFSYIFQANSEASLGKYTGGLSGAAAADTFFYQRSRLLRV